VPRCKSETIRQFHAVLARIEKARPFRMPPIAVKGQNGGPIPTMVMRASGPVGLSDSLQYDTR